MVNLVFSKSRFRSAAVIFCLAAVLTTSGKSTAAATATTVSVKAWGFDASGGLGIGRASNNAVSTPQTVIGGSDFTAFGGGREHSVVLRSDGTVTTAGANFFGQLGNGTIGGIYHPIFGAVTSVDVFDITAVSGGSYHSLALRSDGTVWAWGAGTNGQLGNGAFVNSGTPVRVGANLAGFDGQVVQISGGEFHNLALTADGRVWAWGDNQFQQLGDGTAIDRSVPVPVQMAGGGSQVSGVTQIGAGEYHSAILRSDGTVFVWGYNGDAMIGNGTTTTSGCRCVPYPTQTTNNQMGAVAGISVGSFHVVALKSNGDVWVWGRASYGQVGDNNTAPAAVPRKTPISNVVRIEAHLAYHILARTGDGRLFAWGYGVGIGNGHTALNQLTPLDISAPAGTGGNLGTNIAAFGTGDYDSFTSRSPQGATPNGASVLRGDQYSVAFPASTVAGTTEISIFDPTATGLNVPTGYQILANSTGYEFSTTAQFSGTATVCLKVPNVADQTTFNSLSVLHDDNADGTLDQNPNQTRDYPKREICRPTASFSPFILAQGFAPTAADVSIGGRVTTGRRRGIKSAQITLTAPDGTTRTILSNAFGYYQFADVPAGATYILSVSAKRYVFANPTRAINASEDISDADFVADDSANNLDPKGDLSL